jgi:electron transport complex protein RnfB
MQSVVTRSVVALSAMAAVFGAILAVASRSFAEALVKAEVEEGVICPPGGAETMNAVADILGVEAGEIIPKVAVVHCAGGISSSAQRLAYEGIADCRAAVLVGGGPKACIFGCLGLGTCRAVCPFDAVTLDADGVVDIDGKKCTGCGNCVEACPVNIIELVPRAMRVHVRCSSHDKGPAAKKVCSVSCIGCQLCVKKCPYDAIHMDENLAVTDYTKCTNCGICAVVCPTKAIVDEVAARPTALIGTKCEGVGKCKEVCPVKAIEGEPGQRHEVNREKCIGCGLCMEACPTKAITMVGALGLQKEAV